MIEFKETDFNLTKVRRESKLFNLITVNKYFIYGLRQSDNPTIMIEYHYNNVEESFGERLDALKQFLTSNSIDVEIYDQSDNKGRVDIGLRKDLRSIVNKNRKPMLASSVLSTTIYALEGRIDIEQLKNYKLLTMPKLEKIVKRQTNA
jgi:hypothetical protein